MKKNQLLDILALMLALGINFPATIFAAQSESADSSRPTKSSNPASKHKTKDGKSSKKASAKTPKSPTVAKNPTTKTSAASTSSTETLAELPADFSATSPAHADGTVLVNGSAELVAAIAAPTAEPSLIYLTQDIFTDHTIQIARDLPLTINLNGHSIISCGGEFSGQNNALVIDVEYGELSITGEGSIMAMNPGSVALNINGSINESTANYAKVLIDQDVRLYAPNSYGITIGQGASAAYGVTLELRGSITAQDGIYINGSVQGAGDNAPVIQLADSAVVNAENTGLVAAGFAHWACGASTISSSTGVKAFSGDFAFAQTSIFASGEDLTEDGAGAALLFGGEAPENVKITIDGGAYMSAQNYVFADFGPESDFGSNLELLDIKNGQFSGALDVFYGFDADDEEADLVNTSPGVVISGGTFSADISGFLAPHIHLEETADDCFVAVDEAALELAEAKAELQAALNLARAKEERFYTPESYQDFVKVIQVLAQSLAEDDLTLDEINDASLKLSRALDSLEPSSLINPENLTAAQQELTEAITAARNLDPYKYDADDYHDFMELINEAEALLAQTDATVDNFESMLGEIDAMREILLIFDEEQASAEMEQAVDQLAASQALIDQKTAADDDPVFDDNLADEAALDDGIVDDSLADSSLVDETLADDDIIADELAADEALTTELAATEFDDSLRPAQLDEPEFSEPAAVAPAIDPALDELQHGLSEMLVAVVDLKITDYRPESTAEYYDLQAAIIEARELLAQPSQVTAAALAESMNKVLAATSGLKDTTSAANSPVESQSSQPSFAQAEFTVPTSSQSSIATTAPETDAATPKTDLTILREIIAQISQLDSSAYTAASYASILTILAQAKDVIASPTASQDDINQIVLRLYRAMNSLVPTSSATSYSSQTSPSNTLAANTTSAQTLPLDDDTVTPSFMMSALAGLYTGIAMYRKSRVAAKNAKTARALTKTHSPKSRRPKTSQRFKGPNLVQYS